VTYIPCRWLRQLPAGFVSGILDQSSVSANLGEEGSAHDFSGRLLDKVLFCYESPVQCLICCRYLCQLLLIAPADNSARVMFRRIWGAGLEGQIGLLRGRLGRYRSVVWPEATKWMIFPRQPLDSITP
jgi:hypothetical protein